MLAACTEGTNGNLFQLCGNTAFKLIFKESIYKCYSVGVCWFARACITDQTSLQNTSLFS